LAKGGWKDLDKWDEVISSTVDTMTRLEKALKSHIQKLEIEGP